jgi:RNA polymerase sigma factor (sigma-70 family)
VDECLRGNEQGWSAIVDKYKGMVYCAAMKHQMGPQDAADLFQEVWSSLYPELKRLRKPGAVGAWLIPVVWHKCNRWLHDRPHTMPPGREVPFADWKEHAERVQILRDTVSQLPDCCQRMVNLLFQWDPPLTYAEAARQVALAEGPGDSNCQACLERLRAILEQKGF